jgi:galactose mutarotase-like enzyme
VDYILTENNELDVIMTARSQSPTPVNLLHHTYWNLGGHDSGTILDQLLMIDANSYTPGGAIPNGEIVSVENTPYDFRTSTAVGERLGQLPGVGESPGGYDLNYVLEDAQKRTPAATLMDPVSGLRMELFTNQPGLQFYSGNWLEGIVGKGNAVYDQNDGLCLETQAFPDSINKAERSGWQDIVLRPGQVYRHEMTHRFTTVPTAGASSVQGGR